MVRVQRWLHLACFPYLLQRPTAKELLKHKFITRYTKKTSFLMELIDRFKRWKSEGHGEDSSSGDSDMYVRVLRGGVSLLYAACPGWPTASSSGPFVLFSACAGDLAEAQGAL